ncbi:MAG TPA: hypothetical protein PL196_05925 [Burkholderiaceae bacterium]|nr:hypothetical protein [Burkholderiaceae bacterium]
MLDRLFMPALTFTLLVAATAAFATELASGPGPTAVERQAAAIECIVASAATQTVALLEPAAAALR